MKKWIVVLGVACACVGVRADVIYYDALDGDGQTPLNGLAPDLDATGGAVWTAHSVWKADGSRTAAGSYGMAGLPFTPENGKVYQITLRVSDQASNSWSAFGLVQYATDADAARFVDAPKGAPFTNHWGLAQTGGAKDTAFRGPGTGSTTVGTHERWKDGEGGVNVGPVDLRIILDTRTSPWSFRYQSRCYNAAWPVVDPVGSFDEYTYTASTTYPSNPTIGAVGFTTYPAMAVKMGPIVLEEIGEPDKTAKNPSPKYIEAKVPLSTSLSWTKGSDPNTTGHYLYMVADEPNFVGVTPVFTAETGGPIEVSPPITLANNKTYFWRVDESVNGSGPGEPNTVAGSVWFFDTPVTKPVIMSDPGVAAVSTTETATLAIDFTSGLTPTVSWYKVGEPDVLLVSRTGGGTAVNGDYTVTVTSLGASSYTTTLHVANAEMADEGYYFCDMTNAGGAASPAATLGNLVIKRLLAHYRFDGDYTDAQGGVTGVPAGGAGDPPYLGDGAPNLGQAVVLDREQKQVVQLPLPDAYPRPGVSGGLESGTVAGWVKLSAGTGFQAIIMDTVDRRGVDPLAYTSITFGVSNGNQISCRLRDSQVDTDMPNVSYTAPATLVGQWHLVTATYAKGEDAQMYLDGLPVGNTDFYKANPVYYAWVDGMGLGAQYNGGNGMDGSLDDVRIYNYRLSNEEIAYLYLTSYPDTVFCVSEYASEFDFDGNCRVDLADFAQMAAEWLSCGRYPAGECNN